MIEIKNVENVDRDEIIALVLHCQNDGTRPLRTVDDQPELLHIREKYMGNGGGFWVAKENGKVVGSIGLMMAGNGIGILKKFFVYEPWRGKPHYLGRQLYDVLIEFARQQGIEEIILDTPKNADRAHEFYIRAGFEPIPKEALPVVYDYPYSDSDFFRLDLKKSRKHMFAPA